MTHGLKLAVIYNSELLKYCVDLTFIVINMFVILFYYFLFIVGLFNDVYKSLHYTECNRRNGPDFGRVFLRSNYTDITQNTYIQS